jgi:5-methylcytosine-specific restriction endonuclease McrA
VERTLLLNASFEPLTVISWQRAVTLFFLGKVEVVQEYEEEIHSVSLVIRMPAVVKLVRYVKFVKGDPPLSRANLLARDNFQCQYCALEVTHHNFSIDHVHPRSQGGGTYWENVVVACHPCNRKKGGRTPEQARMKLLKPVIQPDWLPVITFRFNNNVPPSWVIFLKSK